jgi:polysaccharide pyruvyl transferase CsaB
MNITISGYYGFGNIGDEAVLAGILAGLREAGVDAQVTVVSGDPARTASEHPGVKAVGRTAFCGITRAILRADLFISGGGSLFQDVTSARSAYYYLSILRLAQILRRKTMIYAQGVGPLHRPRIRAAVAKAFNRADAVTVRDQDSRALLHEIGVTREVQVCADPSFLVEPDLDAADRIIREVGLVGRELVGVSLRPWPGHDDWLTNAARTISGVCLELGAQAAFIPMQEPEDAAFGEGAITLSHRGNPRIAKGLVARCVMIVGMRLHSLVFAAGAGVPFVSIAYDPKVASFASEAGGAAEVRIGEPDSNALAEALRAAWNDRDSIARALASKSVERRESAILPAATAAELLR